MPYHSGMLAQILGRQTNAHPYHVQVISFWLSIGPIVVILALIVFVQLWRLRRNRKKTGPVRTSRR